MTSQMSMFGPSPEEGRTLSKDEFILEVRRVILLLVDMNGTVDADSVRDMAANLGLEPVIPNWWGEAFNPLFFPELREIGRKRSCHPGNNGRNIAVWGRKKE